MPMLPEVERTVLAVDAAGEDLLAASLELARLYAHQLDQAAAIRAQADKALAKAEQSGDESLIELVSSLKAKVSEQGTVERIGAKLHALLSELQATPKARVAKPADRPAGALSKLRAVP